MSADADELYGEENSAWESVKSGLKAGAVASLVAYSAWAATDYAETSLENIPYNPFGLSDHGAEEYAAEQMEEWHDESLPYRIAHVGEYLAYESMD